MDKRDWKTILIDFENSGLSRSEFAKSRGIPTNSLSYNLRRQKSSIVKKPNESEFVKIGDPSFLEIVVDSETLIRIPDTISKTSLKTILEAIRERNN